MLSTNGSSSPNDGSVTTGPVMPGNNMDAFMQAINSGGIRNAQHKRQIYCVSSTITVGRVQYTCDEPIGMVRY